MKKHSLTKGFTIIETLVAITILMIAIAGPLTIAHKGLLAAVYAQDQITASYLAQDAVEFIKNVRDNNIIEIRNNNQISWLRGFECISTDTAVPASYCIVDTINGSPSTPNTAIVGGITSCTLTTCGLYKGTNGYTHTSNGSLPKYKRYFYISANQSSLSSEAKAVVIVEWSNGLIQNEIIYEAELFNVIRG